MDEIASCPTCHQPVDQANYFCPNCGKKLRSPPLSTSFTSLVFLCLKTLLLPPLGLYWGYQYLRQPDKRSKLVGLITVVVTIVETILMVQYTINTTNAVQQQANHQIQLYGL